MDALTWFSFCVRSHALPSEVVGLVLVLWSCLLGNAIEKLVGFLLCLMLLLIFVHFYHLWDSMDKLGWFMYRKRGSAVGVASLIIRIKTLSVSFFSKKKIYKNYKPYNYAT